MNILLFDTETTGLKPQRSFIISNGAVLWNTETGAVSEFYEVLNWKLIFENFSIPEDTIKVHGITDEIMESEGIHPLKSMSNFYRWIMEFVGNGVDENGRPSRLDANVAFNLPFDQNMYTSNLKCLCNMYGKNFAANSNEAIDTINLLSLFTKDYGENDDGKPLFIDAMIIDQIFHFEVDGEKVRHDLDSVGNRYGLLSDPNAHNAIADSRRTFKVFKIQLKEIEERGLALDSAFEARLMKKYQRNQEYWGKGREGLDYLGKNMVASSY